ncbi:MAG: hypothetical protein KJ587_17475 [Alphaproteobacteria bacterium]|nr:hypothetical protein [Alphaproteobacteria bacterium]
MKKSGTTIPPCVYLVADNLDAALAAGEDLIASTENWATGDPSDPGVAGAQRWALSRYRCHELNLVARIVQAREHVAVLGRDAPRFRPLAQLFCAATADLAAAFHELNEQVEADFETGGAMTAYLRTRGMIDPEAAGVGDVETPEIGDEFLVAAKVPLGVCLDLVAEFLDALDMAFDLYPEDERSPVSTVSASGPGELDDAAIVPPELTAA